MYDVQLLSNLGKFSKKKLKNIKYNFYSFVIALLASIRGLEFGLSHYLKIKCWKSTIKIDIKLI